MFVTQKHENIGAVGSLVLTEIRTIHIGSTRTQTRSFCCPYIQ